jgi:membrane-bound lytic murein transglycosylase MltF
MASARPRRLGRLGPAIRLLERLRELGRTMMDANFKDEPMDQLNEALLTFACYNAGPGKIRQLRREAAKRGLDPNVWFGNEQITSERIGRETVTYVSDIYKNYVAYRLIVDENQCRRREGECQSCRGQEVEVMTVSAVLRRAVSRKCCRRGKGPI